MSRIRTAWALGLGFLVLAGWANGGEPPPFRETARVTLHQWVSQDGQWRHPSEFPRRDSTWTNDELGDDVEMAATTFTWISQTGIWASDASWKPPGQPGDGGINVDTALFDGGSNVSVIGTTPGGNGLARIVTMPKYLGDLGAPGNPLVLEIDSPGNPGNLALFRGRGNHYFKGDTGNFANVVIDTGTFDRIVSLDGALFHVFVKSGKFEFVSTTASILSLALLTPDARGEILGDISASTDLRILAGTLVNRGSNWQTITMQAGHLRQIGLLRDAVDVLQTGGWLEYEPTVSISGHNPDMWILGGTLDLSKLTEDLVATDRVIGLGAGIIGNLLGQGDPDASGALSIQIDLDQDYP